MGRVEPAPCRVIVVEMLTRSTVALTIPVAMGYVPLGAAFGFLVRQAGGDPALALAMSVVVYAGALQFLAIPLLMAGLPVAELAFVTLMTNLRHVFYGLSLRDRLPRGRLARAYAVFALTDETFSLVTSAGRAWDGRQVVMVAAINQLWWVAGTALGCVLGEAVPTGIAGMEFALTALFVVLTIEQAKVARRVFPFATAAVATAIAFAVAPGNLLFAAIALTLLAILAAAARRRRETTA